MAVLRNDINSLTLASLRQVIGLTQRFDNSGPSNQPVYIGLAMPGSLTSDAVWQIQKLSYDSNNMVNLIQWGGGVADYINIWDNRVTLTYS
jgi:hypothetical protein